MTISIITPSFNQGAFIERTIQSVLNQNIDGLQYWVIDGGSQDNTIDILKKYADQLKFVSEQDHGQAHAVNKGLAKISGEIIGWLNSDDIYYPETLKKIISFFNSHPDIDMVYGNAYHIDENDHVLELYPTESWSVKRLFETCYLSQPAVFFRNTVLTQFGFLDESLKFCMDYEYWLRCALKGVRIAHIPDILSGSRLHPHAKTISFPIKATYETLTMLKKKLNYIPARWLLNYAVLITKQKIKYRTPHPIFLAVFSMVFTMNALRWNGLVGGLLSLISLPLVLKKKKESIC